MTHTFIGFVNKVPSGHLTLDTSAEAGTRPPVHSKAPALDLRVDEEGLATLDTLVGSHGFDAALLQTSPVRDIRQRISELLGVLDSLDTNALVKKPSWLERLTGADVEARLTSELVGRDVLAAAARLHVAERNGARLRQKLVDEKSALAAEQARLEAAIFAARAALTRDRAGADDFILGRFERRVANMEALYGANIIFEKQLELAMRLIIAALDRCIDVRTAILPLWERQLVALLQATDSAERRNSVASFTDTHSRLTSFLRQEPS